MVTPIRKAKRQRTHGVTRRSTGLLVFQLNIILAAVAAAVLWIVGLGHMAIAIIAVLPVALFRTWLFRNAIDRGLSAQRVVARALIRTVLSLTALIVGSLLGVEILLGVLVGLGVELIAYVIGSSFIGRET